MNPAAQVGTWRLPKASVGLPATQMKLLGKMWRDGDLWVSLPHLGRLLSAMLQEATQTSAPVPPESWSGAAPGCVEWTTGENKGKASAPGSFQRALLRTRPLGSTKVNILQHWYRLVMTCPLTHMKYHCRTVLANVQPEQAEYTLYRINHELSRINSNKKKRNCKGRRLWYAIKAAAIKTAPHATPRDQNRAQETEQQFQEYMLEAIVQERVSEITGRTLFKCRWEGCSALLDTWEHIAPDHPEFIRWRARHPAISGSPIIQEPPPKKAKTSAVKESQPKRTPTSAVKEPQPKKTQTPLAGNIRKPTRTPGTKEKPKLCSAPRGSPDSRNQDQAVLVKGSVIWIEYFGETNSDEMKWFAAEIILVSASGPLKRATVFRVLFEDGQKETLNLRGVANAHELEQIDPSKYSQFNWSSGSI